MLNCRRPNRRKSSSGRNQHSLATRLVAIAVYTAFFLVITPVFLAIVYRFVPVPVTPLMVVRLFEGHGLHKTWKPLNQISPHLRQAVVAAEDNLFCVHNGFDWKALNKAIDQWQEGNASKGGSTISQQTAKNVYLLPTRSILRKAVEMPLTMLIENLWPKQRILEVYLNIAEWAPGVYGAEAAARHHFKTSAKNLTRQQAAQLAAILPRPLHWSAAKPGPYVRQRSNQIIRRISGLGPTYLGCTQPLKK
ncbi:MAG: monofunctional biosynthetic peptidoglycan transglycosylase [Alphaproteobacteria bacterium]|nr:MAG: monofunctional biosynthetic peptidoglycan transglycosylase [Alphaproteobacteria bacterium]